LDEYFIHGSDPPSKNTASNSTQRQSNNRDIKRNQQKGYQRLNNATHGPNIKNNQFTRRRSDGKTVVRTSRLAEHTSEQDIVHEINAILGPNMLQPEQVVLHAWNNYKGRSHMYATILVSPQKAVDIIDLREIIITEWRVSFYLKENKFGFQNTPSHSSHSNS